MWYHPKYYKELRKRNKSDQAISDEASTEATSVRPGPGLKVSSSKPRVASSLTREPWNMDIEKVLEDKGPRVFVMINVL